MQRTLPSSSAKGEGLTVVSGPPGRTPGKLRFMATSPRITVSMRLVAARWMSVGARGGVR
jgi:hypothetical protein